MYILKAIRIRGRIGKFLKAIRIRERIFGASYRGGQERQTKAMKSQEPFILSEFKFFLLRKASYLYDRFADDISILVSRIPM